MLVLVSDSLVLWDVTAFTDFSSTFYSKCLLLVPNNAFYHNYHNNTIIDMHKFFVSLHLSGTAHNK